ncbi:MAG: electron transfer flavoprotein subunit beta/FixA family protein [Phycisphaerae bacterium]
MAYNIVVLVKQVPDTKRLTADAMRDDGTVNRTALPAIFNPEDLYALETALRVRERCGGRVTVVTMGPPQACEALRESLERGADDVVLITDRRAAASDTLATSYILSCAVRKLGAGRAVDLVICGRQAIDGDTAQVPPQTAEKLGWPQVTYVEAVEEIGDGRIVARRNTGRGTERVSCPLPCLLTVTDGGPQPRPPSAKRIMAVKKARSRAELARDARDDAEVRAQAESLGKRGLLITQWDLDDIEADLAWCGRDGSPTKVKRIQSVVLTGSGFKKVEPAEEAVAAMVHELIEDHTIG